MLWTHLLRRRNVQEHRWWRNHILQIRTIKVLTNGKPTTACGFSVNWRVFAILLLLLPRSCAMLRSVEATNVAQRVCPDLKILERSIWCQHCEWHLHNTFALALHQQQRSNVLVVQQGSFVEAATCIAAWL